MLGNNSTKRISIDLPKRVVKLIVQVAKKENNMKRKKYIEMLITDMFVEADSE